MRQISRKELQKEKEEQRRQEQEKGLERKESVGSPGAGFDYIARIVFNVLPYHTILVLISILPQRLLDRRIASRLDCILEGVGTKSGGISPILF